MRNGRGEMSFPSIILSQIYMFGKMQSSLISCHLFFSGYVIETWLFLSCKPTLLGFTKTDLLLPNSN